MTYTNEHIANVIMMPSSVLVGFHGCSGFSVLWARVLSELPNDLDIFVSMSAGRFFSNSDEREVKWSINESNNMLGG